MATPMLLEDNLAVKKEQIDAAEMLVAGYNVATVAETIGVSKNTVQKWIREDEDFRKLLQRFTGAVVEEIKIELANACRNALYTMKELLQSKDEKIRLKAAQDILDRGIGKAADKREVDIKNTNSYFMNLSEAELMRYIRLGDAEVIDIEPTEQGAFANGSDGATAQGS